MRYLAMTKKGGAVSRKIAEQGRRWQQKAFRKEDASVYLGRLFLEVARLLDETRAVESLGAPT